jgi:hypothetical protein
MNGVDDIRARLGIRLVFFSTIALVVLAIFVVVGGVIAEYRSQGGGQFERTSQLLLSSLLPLFGTWVGTVLAFYFSKENFEAANRGALDVVRSISQRLSTTKVIDAMMPRARMITLNLAAGQTLDKVLVRDVENKFNAVGMNGQRISRLPILDADGRYVAFLHRGVWTEMAATALAQSGEARETIELGPLLTVEYPLAKGQNYGDFIRRAAGFVAQDRSLADAKAVMEGIAGCQDIIVTEHGKADEAVVGWISNIDIGRLSQA